MLDDMTVGFQDKGEHGRKQQVGWQGSPCTQNKPYTLFLMLCRPFGGSGEQPDKGDPGQRGGGQGAAAQMGRLAN